MALDRRNSFAAIPQLDAKLEKILNDNVIFEKKVINIQEFQSDFYSEYGQYKELIAGRFGAVTADIVYLKTFEADIKNLEADNATINGKLEANSAEINTLKANDVTITGKLEVHDASIENLEADNVTINGKLTAQEAEITNLSGEFASFVSGEFGTLSADVADIQTLMFGSATGTAITSEFANTVVSHIGEAQIDSAMIKDLTFDKITGFDVNTTNLTIHSEDGKSQWYDNTIQISDANRVRVQIGKDASNDYSMYVWDAVGNLMFDALGLTASGIQREIIRNDMVAKDAAINGSKLDIESVFREMDGSTYTLTSNHLTYDGKSLDLTLKSMSETDKEQGQLLSSQGTQITAIQGQIASKIWQQDIDTATGEMNTKYSELEQELGGFKTTVGETYSTKADVNALTKRVETAETSISQNTEQILLRATKSEVTTAKDEALNESKSYTDAQIKVSADGITSSVSKTYATKEALTAAETRITQTENSINSQVGETNGLKERMSTVEQTADKFTWLVESGTSSSNFTLTDRVASLLSSEFQIDALTTFKNSATDGTSTVINGGAIKANTISADKLNVTDLSTLGATIGGFTIGASSLHNGTTSLAGADNSVYLGLDGISCGTKFKVDKAGALTAKSGSIGVFDITEYGLYSDKAQNGIYLTYGLGYVNGDGAANTGVIRIGGYNETPNTYIDPLQISAHNYAGEEMLLGIGAEGFNIYNETTYDSTWYGNGRILSDSGFMNFASHIRFENERQVGTTEYPSGRHVLANNTSVSFLNTSATRVRGIGMSNSDHLLIGDDSGTAGMYGYITAQNNIVFYAGTSHDQCFASIYSNGARYFQSKPIYDRTTSSGTAVRVNSNGTLYRYSSSSMRYKEEITCQLNEELNPERLYDLNVWQYKYREGHLDKGDQRYGKTHIGLIAEDVKQHYPIAANFNEDGYVEDWSERYLIPPMLKLIQMQHEEIELIKAELERIRNAE